MMMMGTAQTPTSLLEAKHLFKEFAVKAGFSARASRFRAVNDVNVSVRPGETFALVGESGCGKSTLAKTILLLTRPSSGEIYFEARPAFKSGSIVSDGFEVLRREMQMVFQDPISSFDPRMHIKTSLSEAMVDKSLDKRHMHERFARLLENVGLGTDILAKYPHQLSGGELQRMAIARTLVSNPKLLVLDEPTSALDVSVQARVLNLLKDLQERLGLTYVFISHDLSVVKHMCDRVAVMYLGRVVEQAQKSELFREPLHPYTKALISAVPVPGSKVQTHEIVLEGDVPSPANPPSGCSFHTRCRYAEASCSQKVPALVGSEHLVACHKPGVG